MTSCLSHTHMAQDGGVDERSPVSPADAFVLLHQAHLCRTVRKGLDFGRLPAVKLFFHPSARLPLFFERQRDCIDAM